MSIVNFKTDAWKESAAAQAYHDATSSAALQMQILRDRNYREYFAEFVAPGKLVLDVGCGSGIIGNGLHDDGYRVVGSDVSPGMLECFEAEKGDRDIELRLGDAFNLPAENEEFDAVVSRMFIQHFPNWRDILREKARVTKMRGIIFFDFANAEHLDLEPGVEEPAVGFPYNRDIEDQGRFYAACTTAEMNEAANELGLEVLSIRPQGLLLYNAHLWNSLKAEGMVELNDAIQAGLQNPDVADFLALIEQKAISLMPPATTYGNFVVLRKVAQPRPPKPTKAAKPAAAKKKPGKPAASVPRRAARKAKRVAKRGAKAVGISS